MDATLENVRGYNLFRILVGAGADFALAISGGYHIPNTILPRAVELLDNTVLQMQVNNMKRHSVVLHLDDEAYHNMYLALWIMTTPVSDTSLETLRLVCSVANSTEYSVSLIAAIEIDKPEYADIIIQAINDSAALYESHGNYPSVAVFTAAIKRSPRTLRYLLAHDIRREFEPFVIEPVHDAVSNIETLEILLKAGFNPNDRDEEGRTPLHIAHTNRKKKAIELLLEYGADPTITDVFGNTPEYYDDDYSSE